MKNRITENLKKTETKMEASGVLELYDLLEENKIKIRLDGGWSVDALLGKQTRSHSDLDIVVENKDVRKLRTLLAKRNYQDIPRDDTSPWNFVLGDDKGHEVDVHAITFDEKGNGLYGPPEKGVMYPAESLTGEGTINGKVVRCISPEHMVKFHTGYELDENDVKDVIALCERFNIELPKEFIQFRGNNSGIK